VIAVASGSFTIPAGAVAALFASIIVVVAGFDFFGLLVLFVVGSTLATRYGFEEKQKAHMSEGSHGERGVPNVLAHIVIPTGLAVGSWLAPSALPVPTAEVLFTAALAFGASDTFASELGVLSGHARSILTLRPVPPGTNGGVSPVGEFWAVVGSLSTGLLSLIFVIAFRGPIPMPGLLVGGASAAGFLGCQVDSVLGETLENRGFLTKHGTNFLAMLTSVVLAAVILWLTGNVL